MLVQKRIKNIIENVYYLDREQNSKYKANKPIVAFCDKHNFKITKL